jgi:RNA polymerase subunit RPABC4/transcription elongation factor Spt4
VIKDTKVCRVCKKEKSRKNDFYIRVPGKMYVSAACKECHVRIPKSQTPEAKAKRRASMRMWRLGVSQEEFDAKFESQGEACAICGSSDSRGSSWHTDHSHLTGEFRGVLCRFCNWLLGFANDNPEVLRKAAQYLAD